MYCIHCKKTIKEGTTHLQATFACGNWVASCHMQCFQGAHFCCESKRCKKHCSATVRTLAIMHGGIRMVLQYPGCEYPYEIVPNYVVVENFDDNEEMIWVGEPLGVGKKSKGMVFTNINPNLSYYHVMFAGVIEDGKLLGDGIFVNPYTRQMERGRMVEDGGIYLNNSESLGWATKDVRMTMPEYADKYCPL